MKAEVKIYAKTIEQEAIDQINTLVETGVFDDCDIRIMPDCHSGAGCVIGFTSGYKDKIISNIVGVDISCLDKDTEILTPQGWIKISDYQDQDILVFDRSKWAARYEKPIAYIKAPCDEFYYFKNTKGLNQMLSKEHSMLVLRRSSKKSKGIISVEHPWFFETLKKETLIKGYYQFFAAFTLDDNLSGISLSDDLIRIDIMVQADGHIELHRDIGKSTKHYNYEMHFSKDRKIERCKQLLEAAKIQYKTHVNPKDNTTTITFQLPEELGINKNLTKYYYANSDQLKIVAEECLKWDGYEGYRSCYFNTDKSAVDVIQFAFSATGIRAGIFKKDSTEDKYSDSYQVIPTKNPTVGYTEVPVKVKSEDGFKYCFTTNTGYFIARRGNHIFITGNCGMLLSEFSKKPDTKQLQETIEKNVPAGREIHESTYFGGNVPKVFTERYRYIKEKILELRCYRYLKEAKKLPLAIGSLGGGEERMVASGIYKKYPL